jgi:Ca-activated chloride channel family protein
MHYRFVVTLALAYASAIGLAQEKTSVEDRPPSVTVSRRIKPPTPAASLRLHVNRVLVPVTVTDSEDHRVEGLRKEAFRLLEDGAPREITDFFIDESPVSVGIVLDSSNSMRHKFNDARQAVAEFLRMSHLDDEFFLVAVQDHPELLHAFIGDANFILQEMEGIQPRGFTALYDGMYLGINQLRRAKHDHRVLLVLSDGGDNNSRYTESEIKHLVQESDVRIFTISILDRSPSVERLADQSGGRAFRAHSLEELPEKAIALSALVHGEYVVGFTPAKETRDGRHHVIKVELVNQPAGPRMHVSWRHAYASPLE